MSNVYHIGATGKYMVEQKIDAAQSGLCLVLV